MAVDFFDDEAIILNKLGAIQMVDIYNLLTMTRKDFEMFELPKSAISLFDYSPPFRKRKEEA